MTLFDSSDDLGVRSSVRVRPGYGTHAPSEADVTYALRATPTARLDVGHSQLAYYRFGQGPDVVFVHGWPLHAATFRKLVPLLASGFTCHLIDLPGAGQTHCNAPEQIDVARFTDTVRTAVDLLGLTRYALLAHDSGGVPARILAADDPRVTGLVLANTEIPGHRPWLIELYMRVARSRLARGLMTRTLGFGALRRSPFALGHLFHDRSRLEGEFYELFIAPLLASERRASSTWQLLQTFDYGMVDELAKVHARIRVPTQLIWGTGDPFFPVDKARLMPGQFAGGAEWHEIDRAKLLVHEERAVEFAALARPFLTTCVQAGR
jgi:pimeloyl-ACP methyl ester carboxylesterase